MPFFKQKNILSTLLLFSLISTPVLAGTEPGTQCGPLDAPITEAIVPCLVNELIHKAYPELRDANSEARIKIRNFKSSEYFFKTSIRKGILSSDPHRRHYSVDVNLKIFNQSQQPSGAPSVRAVQGILAHELIHLVDFETGTSRGLASIGLKEVFSPTRYERSTDRQAFERGYAIGISAFRSWVYGKLSARQLRKKQKRYYTPEEITDWLETHPS